MLEVIFNLTASFLVYDINFVSSREINKQKNFEMLRYKWIKNKEVR